MSHEQTPLKHSFSQWQLRMTVKDVASSTPESRKQQYSPCQVQRRQCCGSSKLHVLQNMGRGLGPCLFCHRGSCPALSSLAVTQNMCVTGTQSNTLGEKSQYHNAKVLVCKHNFQRCRRSSHLPRDRWEGRSEVKPSGPPSEAPDSHSSPQHFPQQRWMAGINLLSQLIFFADTLYSVLQVSACKGASMRAWPLTSREWRQFSLFL